MVNNYTHQHRLENQSPWGNDNYVRLRAGATNNTSGQANYFVQFVLAFSPSRSQSYIKKGFWHERTWQKIKEQY